jgi:hypothetical protein
MKELEESIAKWEKNAAAKTWNEVTIGPGDCPLCVRFNTAYRRQWEGVGSPCAGCPVAAKTGRPYCKDTPYERVELFRERWDMGELKDKISAAGRRVIRDELEFLKGLRT